MGNFKTFQRLFSYLKEHRLKLLFVILSAIISTGFMVLAPFLIGKVTTTLFASVTDGVFYWNTILSLLVSLVAFIFHITTIYVFLQGFIMSKVTAKVMQTLRREIDEKNAQNQIELLRYPYPW